MNSIVFPCFPKLILTKFVRSVRPSIVSIIRNHPTHLLLQNSDKNAYEKIAILRKYADGYAATSLTLHSSVCVFFFLSGFSFTNIHDSQDCRERGRLSFSRLSTTSTRFTDSKREPLVSKHKCSFHLYVIEIVQNF